MAAPAESASVSSCGAVRGSCVGEGWGGGGISPSTLKVSVESQRKSRLRVCLRDIYTGGRSQHAQQSGWSKRFRHSKHRSPSLNFTCTNSFGSHRCPATIIKNISVGAEQQRADPYESPTKGPNELLNVERGPFSYANDKSAAQAGEELGSTIRPSREPGIKVFVW